MLFFHPFFHFFLFSHPQAFPLMFHPYQSWQFLLQLFTEVCVMLLLLLSWDLMGLGRQRTEECAWCHFLLEKFPTGYGSNSGLFQLCREQCKHKLLKLKVDHVDVQDHDNRSWVHLCLLGWSPWDLYHGVQLSNFRSAHFCKTQGSFITPMS